MKSKIYLVSIVLFFGCFTNIKNRNNTKQPNFVFDVITYDIDEVDLVQSKVLLNIPLNILVFEKVDEQFESNLEISLKIEDIKTNAQLDRLVWTERILSEFYNYTRNQANFHSLIKDINIAPGEYRFVITITDSKNSLKWKLDNNFKLNINNDISDLFPFYYLDKKRFFINENVPLDIDTIYFDVQFPSNLIIDSVKQIITKEDTIIFMDHPLLISTKNETIYRVPLAVKNFWQGEYQYSVLSKSDTSSLRLYFNSSNKGSLWSNNTYELVGVMSYILKFSDIKKMNSMDDDEKLTFIKEYWGIDNPNQSKKSHELLLELTNRFNFSNRKFTIEDIVKGWESDRGEQYIIRGAPAKIENKYSYERNINYQVWSYNSGEEIIFIEAAMGDYKIQN